MAMQHFFASNPPPQLPAPPAVLSLLVVNNKAWRTTLVKSDNRSLFANLATRSALIACLTLQLPLACFADDHLLFGDKKVIDNLESEMDPNVDPISNKVRSSKIVENWRRAYLHGNDAQSDALLKQILHQLQGSTDILPLVENLAQINMFDEDTDALPERLAPSRFFNDMLVSARKILGPKDFLIADICLYVRGSACDKRDSKRQAALCMEEFNIRRLYPKTRPYRYLRALNGAALIMSRSGQTAQAKETCKDGRAFIEKNGLAKTAFGADIMRNLKQLDATAGAKK